MKATVYSVTTLYAAAAPFEPELPFQLAIVDIEGQGRRTVRIETVRSGGPPVRIGDQVIEVTPQRFRAVTDAPL